ncbi:hypothetical protein HYT02_05540 [Candidatus Gottesmanbacteria bacterium]|nr:hypothetical protein [Candidatus Gottesmanbacteria bacterium]
MTAEVRPRQLVGKYPSPQIDLVKPWREPDIWRDPYHRFPILDKERESCTFEDIQNCLEITVDGKLPGNLSNLLSFPQLGWEYVDDVEAQVQLFLGRDPDSHQPTDIAHALGIIYVDMWKESDNRSNDYKSYKFHFEPHQIGVRGLFVDSTGQARVLGVDYRKNWKIFRVLEEFNIVRINISSSNQELGEEGDILGDRIDHIDFSKQRVDTTMFDDDGKLFTEDMWGLTGTEEDDVHQGGVRFRPWASGDSSNDLTLGGLDKPPREGFRIQKRGKHDLVLSFTPRHVYRKNPIPSWEIVLPKTLDYSK